MYIQPIPITRLVPRNVATDAERSEATRPPTLGRFASIPSAFHLQRYGLVDIRISQAGGSWSRNTECE
jgi:hypothetical protein